MDEVEMRSGWAEGKMYAVGRSPMDSAWEAIQ